MGRQPFKIFKISEFMFICELYLGYLELFTYIDIYLVLWEKFEEIFCM